MMTMEDLNDHLEAAAKGGDGYSDSATRNRAAAHAARQAIKQAFLTLRAAGDENEGLREMLTRISLEATENAVRTEAELAEMTTACQAAYEKGVRDAVLSAAERGAIDGLLGWAELGELGDEDRQTLAGLLERATP